MALPKQFSSLTIKIPLPLAMQMDHKGQLTNKYIGEFLVENNTRPLNSMYISPDYELIEKSIKLEKSDAINIRNSAKAMGMQINSYCCLLLINFYR